MNYPNGTPIQCGDLIWWNEGRGIGFVQMVVESETEYSEMNLEEPHLFIQALHPFDPEAPLFVAYPEHSLRDEEIGPFTASERELLRQATEAAQASLNHEEKGLPYSVIVTRRQDTPAQWQFTFHGGDTQTERQIELITESLRPRGIPTDY